MCSVLIELLTFKYECHFSLFCIQFIIRMNSVEHCNSPWCNVRLYNIPGLVHHHRTALNITGSHKVYTETHSDGNMPIPACYLATR